MLAEMSFCKGCPFIKERIYTGVDEEAVRLRDLKHFKTMRNHLFRMLLDDCREILPAEEGYLRKYFTSSEIENKFLRMLNKRKNTPVYHYHVNYKRYQLW